MGSVHRFPTGERCETLSEDVSDDALIAALVEFADEHGITPEARHDDLHFFDRAMADCDFNYIAEHVDSMPSLRSRIGDVAVFVFNELHISEYSPLVAQERSKIRSRVPSLGTISEEVFATDRDVWREKAAYFAAIVLEFKDRTTQAESSSGYRS